MFDAPPRPEGFFACVPHGALRLARLSPAERAPVLDELTPRELFNLPWYFPFWALPHQLPPAGEWRTWVILGGRGAGKTRAGSEWVRAQVEGRNPLDPGRCKRVALLADTIDQAREVMVMGDSGLLACSPPDRRPEWVATRRMLVWPNGATAQLFSAHDFEGLRGPQFDCAWADELAKWTHGEEAWDMLQFGLRLGDDPRSVVTTTPRNAPVLKNLLDQESTVMTHAPTSANQANLAKGFLEEVHRRYAGTRQGRQELDGLLLDDVEGALWTPAMIEAAGVSSAPPLDRVVVAVDPAVSAGKDSDACGIIVVGVTTAADVGDWRAWVLEDATVQGVSPREWAQAALAARERHGATRIVAEVNQGGGLVEQMLRGIDRFVPFTPLRATRSKGLRAEPAAALYEQGRVRHLPGLTLLEDQMARMTVRGYTGKGSPDRLDALVWALHEALIAPSGGWNPPRVRTL